VRLHDSLLKRSDQSIDLLWANLGAGKTHTLYHLEYLFHLANRDSPQKVLVGFVEMPEQTKGFLDLYRAIIRSLPLKSICLEIERQPPGKCGDLSKAANVFLHGGQPERDIITDWFHAGRPHLTELKACSGIGRRIEDDIGATDALVRMVMALASNKVRLLLLFDEFQRVADLTSTARSRMLSSLRTLFSRSPKYLSAVLAVQSMIEKNALKLIPAELQTLIGKKPTISLPELNLEDAEEFVLGRFDFFRPKGFAGNRSTPFQEGVIKTVLKHLNEKKGMKLIPREILLALAFVYDCISEPQDEITETHALACLHDYGN
jgi:hypothetical protein